MTQARQLTLRAPAGLPEGLTALDTIDAGGKEPVYVVWSHASFCHMACKLMQSPNAARREHAILSAMSHPNIVRPLGLAPPAALLMPYLEGPSLAALLDRAPDQKLGISDALRVAIHIGSALHHVHTRGFVHLDVKPGNIIVTAGGKPVLFDFGTARAVRGPRPPDVTGTDGYIAPEECRLETAGPAADVFSLGVLLFEMLAGRLPFPKGSARNPFPQTSATPARMRDFRPRAPIALEQLAEACLSREPRDRPPLPELMPELNRLINRGPKMWPAGFEPSPADQTVQRRRRTRTTLREAGAAANS